MRTLWIFIISATIAFAWHSFNTYTHAAKDLFTRLQEAQMASDVTPPEKLELSDAEWKKKLTPEAYEVLRKHGTERAFTGEYNSSKEKGVFHCAACDLPLFRSEDKYDSGTGWPSFTQPVNPEAVGYTEDTSLMSKRVEVHCNRCQGHLGHVFEDGPRPTGLRYCMNSVSLKLEKN